MEELEKYFKEHLEEQEMTLLELDNNILEKIDSNSLFDDVNDVLEQKSASYYLDDEHYLIVEFEILNNEIDIFDMKIFIKNVNIY